jgi:hypothetical protein
MDDKLENVIQESLLELVANMIAQDESQNKKNIEDIYQAFDELPLYFAQKSSSK